MLSLFIHEYEYKKEGIFMKEEIKVLGKSITTWKKTFPLLQDIMDIKPVFWMNPSLKDLEKAPAFAVSNQDIDDAAERWQRFTPFLQIVN